MVKEVNQTQKKEKNIVWADFLVLADTHNSRYAVHSLFATLTMSLTQTIPSGWLRIT